MLLSVYNYVFALFNEGCLLFCSYVCRGHLLSPRIKEEMSLQIIQLSKNTLFDICRGEKACKHSLTKNLLEYIINWVNGQLCGDIFF